MSDHSNEETPPPLPTRHTVPVDSVFLAEFRREVGSEFRALRRESSDANREVQQRLSGIEGQLREGNSTMAKHDGQIQELASDLAETRARMDKNIARIVVLEDDLKERMRDAERNKESSFRAVVLSVVCAVAVGAVLSGFAFFWWLFTGWVKAGAPGVGGVQ